MNNNYTIIGVGVLVLVLVISMYIAINEGDKYKQLVQDVEAYEDYHNEVAESLSNEILALQDSIKAIALDSRAKTLKSLQSKKSKKNEQKKKMAEIHNLDPSIDSIKHMLERSINRLREFDIPTSND